LGFFFVATLESKWEQDAHNLLLAMFSSLNLEFKPGIGKVRRKSIIIELAIIMDCNFSGITIGERYTCNNYMQN